MNSRLIAIIVIYGLVISCKHPGSKYTVVVDNVEGLDNGSEVVCAGLTIGTVKHLDLFKDSVIIDIEVNKGFKIPVGSKFIVEKNMFRAARLIVERSNQLSFIKNKDTARGYKDTSSVKFTGSDTTKQRKIKESVQKIADGFKEFFEATSKDSIKNDSNGLQ